MATEESDTLAHLTDAIRHKRRSTLATFLRLNSPADDLLDWKETAQIWPGAEEGVTIYPTASLAGDVRIGQHAWIGPNCILDGTGGLSIGEYCSIGSGAQIFTHDSVAWALSGGALPIERSPVSIGDRCFIGSLSTVLRGVSVGSLCVVAAGAVVSRNVPERSVVAGVPARVVGTVHGDGKEVQIRMFSQDGS